MNEPLVNNHYLLEKFPGKGGWTYASIPEILQDGTKPFGWVRVKGSIDGYELHQYKLMPMGEGRLFLPVKAAIRKKIGKQAGDYVKVVLCRDESPTVISEEIMLCFEYEPKSTFKTFQSLSNSGQKAFLDWIQDAKTEETKGDRILIMMKKLEQGLSFYDRLDK